MISPRAAPGAAKSLLENAHARQNVRSNAKAVGQRRSKRCRDTRSASRANALHDRARRPRRKQLARGSAVTDTRPVRVRSHCISSLDRFGDGSYTCLDVLPVWKVELIEQFSQLLQPLLGMSMAGCGAKTYCNHISEHDLQEDMGLEAKPMTFLN